jgi:hypothetical protein
LNREDAKDAFGEAVPVPRRGSVKGRVGREKKKKLVIAIFS